MYCDCILFQRIISRSNLNEIPHIFRILIIDVRQALCIIESIGVNDGNIRVECQCFQMVEIAKGPYRKL